MTWGSASADRSIIALKPLPRTPVPAQPGRTPGHRDRTDGALRSTASLVPPGTGSTALFGGRAAPFHEARQAALFGGPGARPHRGTASGTLRRAGRTTSPRHGKRHSSEGRAHDLTGTGNLELFGASGPPFHRDREPDLFGGAAPHLETARDHGLVGRTPTHRGTATGTLRSAARTASLGHGNRHSSERRAHGLIGTGNPELFGASGPPPFGTGQTALFGAPPASPRRDRDPELFGARVTDPTGAGNPDLLGGSAHPPRLGQGPPASPRQPAPFGASRARTRDWDPGPPRRPGLPISRATGHPAPRGRATGDLRAGINGLYATRLGGLAVGNGHRPRSATSAGQDGNDRRATAAVMRYGCWRGEIFKGCEPRRGDSRPSDRVTFGWHVKAEREKRGEPLTGCGVQQTRDLHAE